MGKRKHSKDDLEDIDHKLKKLERKLLRVRRRHTRSPSSPESLRASSHSSDHRVGEENDDDLVVPIDDFYDNIQEEVVQTCSTAAVDNTQVPLGVTLPSIEQPALDSAHPTTNVEVTLEEDVLQILGEDPSTTAIFGKEIHKELANRLQHILINGLTKDARKELTSQYLVPANCPIIAAPELNLEIKAALPEMSLKRDKAMETRQKQLASAISCLSEIASLQLQSKDKNNSLLGYLMNATRILCDLQHADSIKRRYFASSSLKKDITDQLIPTKIDKYLFGENLAETLKAAKAVSKSGAEIKVDYNKNTKKPTQPQPSTSRNLNWKMRGSARRQPAPQNNRQPALARMRPESSSRPSQRHQPPSKNNRRR